MDDSATTRARFETPTPLALEAAFDGGRLTSDGGLPWLAKMDAELGLCETMAATNVPEWRRGASVRHSLLALVRQRVYQVACGYEDQNDANSLRAEPLLKLACGRGCPTRERTWQASLRSRGWRTPPVHVPATGSLELPWVKPTSSSAPKVACRWGSCSISTRPTTLPTANRKGATIMATTASTCTIPSSCLRRRERSACHGRGAFSGHNAHASRSGVAILKRVVARLRSAWPSVRIEIRADAGFAVPSVYEWCEQEGVDYTIGLITNSRQEAMADPPLLEQARERYRTEGYKVSLLSEGSYRAGSWDRERRVIYKAEVMEQGANRRFVVTSKKEGPKELYDWYVGRGEIENRIKDFKVHLKADRLSCQRFVANQFRLLLHAAAA